MKEKKIKKLINTLIPKPEGPFSLDELSNITGAEIFNHDNTYIKNINNVFDASEGDITFVDNPKYVNEINKTKASAIIVSYFNKKKANTLKPLLLLKNPYLGYSKIANYFYPNRLLSKVSNTKKNNIAKPNYISSTTIIQNNVFIDENANIGSFCSIGPNVIIGKNSVIGNNVNIANAFIGNNAIIQNGTVIGQDGFGYALNTNQYHKIPQIGLVVMGNNVEFGCNCTIDKGSLKHTEIGNGVKVDNLVHIAHNVKIGDNTVIAGQTGIAGSTLIGKNVMIGGQVGIAGHLNIGDNVKIGAQAGVTKNILSHDIVSGTPAIKLKSYLKQSIILKKMVNKNG